MLIQYSSQDPTQTLAYLIAKIILPSAALYLFTL